MLDHTQQCSDLSPDFVLWEPYTVLGIEPVSAAYKASVPVLFPCLTKGSILIHTLAKTKSRLNLGSNLKK